MIQRLRTEHPGMLVFEAGDLLFARRRQPGSRPRHLFRARFILKSLGKVGIDAWCPSASDLGLGLEELRRQAAQAGIPAISANLEDATGAPVLPGHRLLRHGDLRLAVIGLSGPWPSGPLPEGLRLSDPSRALQRVVEALAGQAELFVVLSSLGIEADSLLAAESSIPCILLGAGDDRMVLKPRKVGDSLLLQPYKLGEYLGLLSLKPQTPLWPILDELDMIQLQRRLDQTPADSPDAEGLRRRLRSFSGRSLLRASLRPLTEEDPQDPELQRAVAEQLRHEAGMP